jgi:hypothetical protein
MTPEESKRNLVLLDQRNNRVVLRSIFVAGKTDEYKGDECTLDLFIPIDQYVEAHAKKLQDDLSQARGVLSQRMAAWEKCRTEKDWEHWAGKVSASMDKCFTLLGKLSEPVPLDGAIV